MKKIQIKLFYPGNKRHKKVIVRAPNGKTITSDGVEHYLQQAALTLEKEFPGHDYHLVPIGPGAFNFVCAGEKPGELLQEYPETA